jgi:hypothetical protein
MSGNSTENKPKEEEGPFKLNFELDTAALDARLAAEKTSSANVFRKVELGESMPQFDMAAAAASRAEANVQPQVQDTGEEDALTRSGFLAELTQESQSLTSSQSQSAQSHFARSQRLSDSLDKIYKFLHALSRHVNMITPPIGRVYALDAKTVYRNLVCRKAFTEIRKQSVAAAALNDVVTFGLDMYAPEPVECTRPWVHVDEARQELRALGIELLNSYEIDTHKAGREWAVLKLGECVPVYLDFKGNYDRFRIEVNCRNLGMFGSMKFQLDPEGVTQEFLDNLGRYLIGRADKLPPEFLPLK